MTYKYFLSGSPTTFYSPSQSWIQNFNVLLDSDFYNSSDIFTIKEETYFSSGSFQNVDVRINTSVEPNTGEKLGDDFKTLLFKSSHSPITIGQKFYFDNNYFLVMNTSSIKSLVNTAIVRRCNNILRWCDLNGNIFYEHAVIDYKPTTPDNRNRTDPIIPMGTIHVYSQLNNNTRNIREDQRFLFGNTQQWVCYRVYGGGLINFNNLQTTTNTSAKILELGMGKNYVNETDDNLILGIADYYKYVVPTGSAIINNIQILPIPSYILQSGSQVYSCYLYAGAVQLTDVFTFAVNGSVPSAHYLLNSTDGNHFSIENLKLYMDSPLLVDCVSGANNRQIQVELRGAW
jgi:hypothetical protein